MAPSLDFQRRMPFKRTLLELFLHDLHHMCFVASRNTKHVETSRVRTEIKLAGGCLTDEAPFDGARQRKNLDGVRTSRSTVDFTTTRGAGREDCNSRLFDLVKCRD